MMKALIHSAKMSPAHFHSLTLLPILNLTSAHLNMELQLEDNQGCSQSTAMQFREVLCVTHTGTLFPSWVHAGKFKQDLVYLQYSKLWLPPALTPIKGFFLR